MAQSLYPRYKRRKTNHFEQYGYKSNQETPYDWTDIVDRCPVTYDFFNNHFPFKSYYRVRFMLLKLEVTLHRTLILLIQNFHQLIWLLITQKDAR